jgi:DNA-directed RNA polymerase specialized sigma24 family protein
MARETAMTSYREIAAMTQSPIGSVMSRVAGPRGAPAEAWLMREVGLAEARP